MPFDRSKLKTFPTKPWVYLMKNGTDKVLYVGKAKSLKKRVSTYFQPSRAFTRQPKIRALVEMIRDFEIIEVKSDNIRIAQIIGAARPNSI